MSENDKATEHDEPEKGRISFQDSSTTPRPPTLAEQRARQRVEAEQREHAVAEEAARAEAERKKKLRKRVLIGGGVGVGLVGLIAGSYALASPSTVTARCTDTNGVVVDDQYCDTDSAYYRNYGGYHSGGLFIFPGGRQYHYYYGGSGSVGQRATGGTTTPPSGNAKVTSPSGRTIQRGGFGVKGGGASAGSDGGSGKSGGS
ncbi:MAG: hypothetical protein JOZ47_07860 [Kutzneria sp.]|nr:hypothetical protein [Kutzneria sp.]MBV9844971.1 hypothetical protein [Kutzneria sp.]